MGLISRVSSRTYRTDSNPLKMPAPRNGEYVQVYGRKKTATAVALCKAGKGLIKVNGRPLDKIEPEALRLKLQEPLLVCGAERFSAIDIKIKVSGGGRVAQIYAIRQAISRAVVAYYQKYVDEHSKRILKDSLVQYDRTLMVADPRRSECKKFGGPGAQHDTRNLIDKFFFVKFTILFKNFMDYIHSFVTFSILF